MPVGRPCVGARDHRLPAGRLGLQIIARLFRVLFGVLFRVLFRVQVTRLGWIRVRVTVTVMVRVMVSVRVNVSRAVRLIFRI